MSVRKFRNKNYSFYNNYRGDYFYFIVKWCVFKFKYIFLSCYYKLCDEVEEGNKEHTSTSTAESP